MPECHTPANRSIPSALARGTLLPALLVIVAVAVGCALVSPPIGTWREILANPGLYIDLLALLFLVFMGLTISCIHRWKRHPALEAAVGLCALFIVLMLLMWGSLVIVFSYAPERELVWQGRMVVEEDHSFLDPIYDYYDSHGLFVKEKEPFYTAQAESARLEPERES